jgi:hypothetical protein
LTSTIIDNPLLATFTRTLTESDSKRNIPFTFRVPAGITRLTIRLTFAPLLVDGIRNLLTVTVFDPSGWRGSGHRHGTHEIMIGSRSVSPGFRAGPIQPGEWTVFVDTHMVMPGPPCEIHLEVTAAHAENTGAAGNLEAGQDALPHRQQTATGKAPSRGAGWYRGDLHGHSIHSDAAWDIPDLVAWSRAHRLDFATLSDHNTVSGLPQMDALCAGDLLTMAGVELTTFWGHALALGLRDWIDWRVQPNGRTMEQIAAEVDTSGGLFVIAHPLQVGDPYCTGCQWDYPSMMPGRAHVVEVWNSDWEGESHNEDALKLACGWLNAGHRLALTSGTDNHGRDPDRRHYGFDVVYANDLSERQILHAVRAGHLYISAGPLLELDARVGTRQAMLGDSLDITPGMNVRLAATWEGAAPGATLDLIVDGRSRSSWSVSANGSQAWELECGEAQWCLLTLRESNGRMLALTNPIYLDGRD